MSLIFWDKRGYENVMFTPQNFLFGEEHGVYGKQADEAQVHHSKLSEITQIKDKL